MNRSKIIEFFNSCADSWDLKSSNHPDVINRILDIAEVDSTKTVLDVACGTGVLFPFFKERNVRSVNAIDISPNMVRKASEKGFGYEMFCDDASVFPYGRKYDCIVIFNAFPHFPDGKRLFSHLASHLNKGGTLTVAHDLGREYLNSLHSKLTMEISKDLPPVREVAAMFPKDLDIVYKVEDSNSFQVTAFYR